MSFTKIGPVFILPAGFTADSVDGNIVDNVFVEASLSGDIDGDGDVDFADNDLFVAVLVGTDTDPDHVDRADRADVNGDGSANGQDIAPFVTALLGG